MLYISLLPRPAALFEPKSPPSPSPFPPHPFHHVQLEALTNRLLIETKIKNGAENLLKVFKSGAGGGGAATAASGVAIEREGLKNQVEAELAAANQEIDQLEGRIREVRAMLDGTSSWIQIVESCFPGKAWAGHTSHPFAAALVSLTLRISTRRPNHGVASRG